MASPARMDALDAQVLIEEQVDSGLKSLLEGYRSPFGSGQERRDELNKHLILHAERPIPRLSHSYAQAYAAEDLHNAERQIYALVFEAGIPHRAQAIQELTGFAHPNLSYLHGAGTVFCSHLGEARMVAFVDMPEGNTLADYLNTQGRMHPNVVKEKLLIPMGQALTALRERKTCHGNLRPEIIYMGDTLLLGECISAPCGTLSHYLYEPPERRQCQPLARGETTEKTDLYALGVMVFDLMYGLDKQRDMGEQEFTRLSMDVGCYHAFAGTREFPDVYTDFFRGVFNDNPNERWGVDHLLQWLDGKRFNMIAPATAKEASRPFLFQGENIFNRRVLAYQFHRHWRETVKDIKHMKLDRWADMSLHKPEMAERIERTLRIAGDASTEKHVNDMMSRILSILDPCGPIRGVNITLRPDGIGPLMAQLMAEGNSELNTLMNFIETDISNFWSELDDYNKAEQNTVLWKLQRVRTYMKSRAFGFGPERLLYDLNPSLACQSPLLKSLHIMNPNDALKALDGLAKQLAPDTSFMDRHLAAFVASRSDISKEIRLLDLSTIPALADNPELVVLKILAKAQARNERLVLVGLSTWAAMRVEKMLDEIHNRTIRREMKQQLRALASTGSLNDVLSAVVNRDMALQDHEGFAKAIAIFQLNQAKIEKLRNPRLIDKQASDLGGKLASTISNFVLLITGCFVFGRLLGL